MLIIVVVKLIEEHLLEMNQIKEKLRSSCTTKTTKNKLQDLQMINEKLEIAEDKEVDQDTGNLAAITPLKSNKR